MSGWQHEPEFRQLLRQSLDGHGISSSDFDRLVEITRDAPPTAQAELEGLIQLMTEETWSPDA